MAGHCKCLETLTGINEQQARALQDQNTGTVRRIIA